MTMSGEFVPGAGQAPERNYPTVFGVTLTPAVSAVLIAVVGLGGAIYLGTQLVVPAYQNFQELQTSVNQKEADLAQKTETVRQVNQVKASLDRAKAVNTEVRALFSTQKTLDTLLLDLNRLIVISGAQLVNFTPDFAASGPIIDGSLGPQLNGKLKRQVTTVAFDGRFNQTLTIMRNLERLQTLLVVKDFSAELKSKEVQAGQAQNLVRSAFKLHAYVPLTAEEAAAAAKAAAAQAAANQPK
ncbi:MAG TPA: hypothetical protein V6D03_14200 [Candidatus Caenarcaniphilales bacterium]